MPGRKKSVDSQNGGEGRICISCMNCLLYFCSVAEKPLAWHLALGTWRSLVPSSASGISRLTLTIDRSRDFLKSLQRSDTLVS